MHAAIASVLMTVSAAVPVEAPYPVESVARRHAEKFIDSSAERAVVIGVSSHGVRRVWGFGGFERDGQRVVPDGKTVYEIGSITKTFTGTILADLVHDGMVELDDPVRVHLPSDWSIPTRDDRDISLLHLSTHTSSLPRLPPGFDTHLLLTLSVNNPYSEFGVADLRDALKRTKLRRPIGSKHEYSNLAVGLLGLALAHVDNSGDVDRLFQDRILTPLNLTDTTFTPSEEQSSRMAPPLNSIGWPTSIWHFDCLKACGGLRSTVDDLLTYAEAALGESETSLAPAFRLAMEPWRETGNDEQAMGLGWYVQPMSMAEGVPRLPKTRLIWHGGATGGYQTFIGVMPERHCAIVVLSNSTVPVDPALNWPVMRALLREASSTAANAPLVGTP